MHQKEETPKRVIIAGGRDFNNYKELKKYCDKMLSKISHKVEIVSGGARGADRLGEKYAKEKGYKTYLYSADWESYGKSAGVIRNEQMAEFADLLIAFWDGESKGTANMIGLAKGYGLGIRVYYYENPKPLKKDNERR